METKFNRMQEEVLTQLTNIQTSEHNSKSHLLAHAAKSTGTRDQAARSPTQQSAKATDYTQIGRMFTPSLS